MSGKFKFFQGQGIVREFYVVSVKNEILLKCQGNVREMSGNFTSYNLYQMMRNNSMARAVFLKFLVNLSSF